MNPSPSVINKTLEINPVSSSTLKLLCTDFDGTLIDHEDGGSPPPSEFFERLYNAREKAPVTWVINTGRGWSDLKYDLIAKAFPVWPDWVVLTERLIYQVVDRELVDHSDWNRRCQSIHDDLFSKSQNLFTEIRHHLSETTEADLINDTASPLGIVAKTEEEADRISYYLDDLLSEWPELVYVRNSIWFRFSHIDFNKGTCLREIAEKFQIHSNDILSAGDHCNDLPMLDSQFARGIVCPSNSVEAVKTKVKKNSGFIAQGKAGHGVLEGWKYFFP